MKITIFNEFKSKKVTLADINGFILKLIAGFTANNLSSDLDSSVLGICVHPP